MAFKLNLGALNISLDLDAADFATKMDKVRKELNSLGSTLGKGIMGAGAAFAAGVGYAAKSYAEFEHAVMQAAAVSDLGAKAFTHFEAAAIKASSGTQYSATQAANALQFMAMAGMKTQDAIAALPGVLDLATAGQIELKDAADMTTNILTGMGMTVQELGRVNDVMVKTFTSSNVSMSQLAMSFKYVGPVAKSFGQDIETVSALLGSLGNAGIQADTAGTSLRMMMLRLVKPMKTTAAAMETLQVSIKDGPQGFHSMIDVIAQLEQAQTRLTKTDFNEQLARVFGTEALPSVMALLETGSESLRKFEKDLQGAGGTAGDVAALMRSTLQSQMQILQGNIDNAAIKLGQGLAPALMHVNKFLADTVQKVMDNDDAFVDMRNTIASALEVVGGLIKIFGKVVQAGSYVTAAVVRIVNGLQMLVKSVEIAAHGVATMYMVMEDGFSKASMDKAAEETNRLLGEMDAINESGKKTADAMIKFGDAASSFGEKLGTEFGVAAKKTREFTRTQVNALAATAALQKAQEESGNQRVGKPGKDPLAELKERLAREEEARKRFYAQQAREAKGRQRMIEAAAKEELDMIQQAAKITGQIAAQAERDLDRLTVRAAKYGDALFFAQTAIGEDATADLVSELRRLDSEMARVKDISPVLFTALEMQRAEVQAQLDKAAQEGFAQLPDELTFALQGVVGRLGERLGRIAERIESTLGPALDAFTSIASELPAEVGSVAQATSVAMSTALDAMNAIANSGGSWQAALANLVPVLLGSILQIEQVRMGIASLAMRMQGLVSAGAMQSFQNAIDAMFGLLHTFADMGRLLFGLAGNVDFLKTAMNVLGRALFIYAKLFVAAQAPFLAVFVAIKAVKTALIAVVYGLVAAINFVLEQVNKVLARLRLSQIQTMESLENNLKNAMQNSAENLGDFVGGLFDFLTLNYDDAIARGAAERQAAEEALTQSTRELNDEIRNAPAGFKRLAALRADATSVGDPIAMRTMGLSTSGANGMGNTINIFGVTSPEGVVELLERKNYLRTGSPLVATATAGSLQKPARLAFVGG